tara:strand:- start:269 stop:781 length:513 start_codon:yes stop_codon:yes gene_type:complete
MKKILLSSLLCLLSICVIAQQKIGHVNSQEIMSKMPDIKVIETKIQKESKKMDEMYAEMMQKAQEAAQAFQKAQNDGESESVIKAKYEEAINLEQRMQIFAQDAQQELQTLQNDLLAPVVEKIQNAINDVAKSGKYSYILDTGSGFNVILYNEGPNSNDITSEVKKKLNL